MGRSTTRWLAAGAALLLLIGVVAAWARTLVWERSTFEERVVLAVAPEPVRQALAAEAVTAMLGHADDGHDVAHDLLTATLTGLLGSRTFQQALEAGATLAWKVLVGREDGAVTFDATGLRDHAIEILADRHPEAAAIVRDTPTPFLVTLAEEGEVPTLAPYQAYLRWAAILALALGLLLAVGIVWRARARTVALRQVGAATALVFAGLLVGLLAARAALGAAAAGSHDGVVVESVFQSLARPLGLVAALVATVGFLVAVVASARQTLRVSSPSR